jgi:glycosyltransferase involved in cell wall biosynthesis
MVVDNGSRDDTVERVRTDFPNAAVFALPENRGFAGGNNVGIRAALDAGAEGVLLLNNDARVAPNFLPPLLAAISSVPRCAAASSAVFRLDRPDLLDVAYAEVRFDRRSVVQIIGVNALPGEGFDTRREVEVAVGTSLLLRAEALREVGLLDEAYFAYHEDVDWCLRARRAGWRIVWEPHSRVLHRGSASTKAAARRPPDPIAPWEEQLPNAEPLPWNPVRAYLGARNLVRLLRTYATPAERRNFVRMCRRDLPLEFFAVVLGRAGWMRLGFWDWRRMCRFYFVDRHALLREPRPGLQAALVRALARAVLLPWDLFVALPRDVVRAIRSGRLAEFVEYVRGLRDGVCDRPLPLTRLGLKSASRGTADG